MNFSLDFLYNLKYLKVFKLNNSIFYKLKVSDFKIIFYVAMFHIIKCIGF